jgi:hypothetical protein
MLAERPKPDVDPGVAENVMPPAVSLGVGGSPPSTDPRRRTEATTLTAILSRGGIYYLYRNRLLRIEVDGYVYHAAVLIDDDFL